MAEFLNLYLYGTQGMRAGVTYRTGMLGMSRMLGIYALFLTIQATVVLQTETDTHGTAE